MTGLARADRALRCGSCGAVLVAGVVQTPFGFQLVRLYRARIEELRAATHMEIRVREDGPQRLTSVGLAPTLVERPSPWRATMQTLSESNALLKPYRLTRRQYEQMAEAGVFADAPRVELLHGEVVEMTPQGFPHASVIARLNKILVRLVGDDASVAPQLPFAASDDSEPEPDLFVFPLTEGLDRHPERALLVIEVAATSQRKDREIKGAIYAAAQVPEFWLVDVQRGHIEVYREPLGDHYGWARVFRPGERIELVALPGRSVAVGDVVEQRQVG